MPISNSSVVVAVKHQVSCDLSGEVVILNLQDGVYFGVNAVSARIWSLLQEPTSVEEVRKVLLEEYDVDPTTCDAQLGALLEDLLANGLIEIKE